MEEPKLEPSALADRPWTAAQRVGFRFAFAFWALIIFPFPFDMIPGTSFIFRPIAHGFDAASMWAARDLFGLTGPLATGPNGSGDTILDWVLVFLIVVTAAAAALVWTAVDRRRRHYRRLHHLLRVWMRYCVATAMFSYGLSKVFVMQMPTGFVRAIEPFGKASPMGLLWSFMGLSPAYQIFAGACECLAGVLLLFRRTTSLGGLVCAGVMANVFTLNLCYDVPVKIYSCELMLMGMFLTLPSVGPIIRVLVLGRAVPAQPPLQRSRRRAIGLAVLQTAFTGWIGYRAVANVVDEWTVYGPGKPQASIAGICDVELPSPYTRVAFDSDLASTVTAKGEYVRYYTKVDERARLLSLASRSGPMGQLAWTVEEGGDLVVSGPLEGALVTLRLKKADMSKELLYTRGFHWVNERPFNR